MKAAIRFLAWCELGLAVSAIGSKIRKMELDFLTLSFT